MKEYTLENISEWMKDLESKSKFSQFRVYSILSRHDENCVKQNHIIESAGLNNRFGGKQVHCVSEDLAVIEYQDSRSKETYFIPYVEDHPHSSEWFVSFDRALLAAISLKYTHSVDGGKFAAKMLEVKEND